ncbi:MAG: hypothetical protein V2I65_05600 [Paracoccaceae bacterium]|nr:hypothetical protein [Paracoccaceae bacterium]
MDGASMSEAGRRRRKQRLSDAERIRRQDAWRRRLKVAAFASGGGVILLLVAPLLSDLAMGAAKRAGECRIVTVLDADRFRLSCDIVGRQTARLLGADAPAARGVDCPEEFYAGQRAKWAVRAQLWAADEVRADLDGFGWRETPLVVVTVDDRRLSGWLVEQGLARVDDGYGRGSWCQGEIDALGGAGS